MISDEASICKIGEDTTAERAGIEVSKGQAVAIGARCMISYEVEIRNSVAQSILELAAGRRINVPKSVHINDHVWLGGYSRIDKGVAIPCDVIVGQGALVTRPIAQPKCIVAGNPARVIRTGTAWDKTRLPFSDE